MKKLLAILSSGAAISLAVQPMAIAASFDVLTFGTRDRDRNNAATFIQGFSEDGNTRNVTNSATLPIEDLSEFDVIWFIDAFAPLSSAEQNRLADFVRGGGGLHLTGERPCCEPLNDSITTLVRILTEDNDINIGDLGDIGNIGNVNSNAAQNVDSNFNTLSQWFPSASGGISGIDDDNILFRNQENSLVNFAIWDESHLGGAGRLSVGMDVNWFSNLSGANGDTLENVQIFLEQADVSTSVPEPTTILSTLIMFGIGAALRKRGH